MDKVWKPSNSEYHTPSSETFRTTTDPVHGHQHVFMCLSESRVFRTNVVETHSAYILCPICFSHTSVSEVIKEMFRGNNRGNHSNFTCNFFHFLEERQRRCNLRPQEHESCFFIMMCGEVVNVVQRSSKLKKLRYF
jgi:hypothetical protein